jgi:hypothetical protein
MTDSYITARFLSPGLLIALMMEAARTSETLVNFYQTTLCYNPEDSNLHTHRRENLKSYCEEKIMEMISYDSTSSPKGLVPRTLPAHLPIVFS